MEGPIALLVEALRRIDPDAGIVDAADWMRLAVLLDGETTPAAMPDNADAKPKQGPSADAALNDKRQAAGSEQDDEAHRAATEDDSESHSGYEADESTSELFVANSSVQGDALPMLSPGGRALPAPLAISRALRPLVRRVSAPELSPVLDEEGSIRRVVDSDLWQLLFRSRTKPWLELALVVDEAPSMRIWQRTTRELTELFARLGAFSDVRIWRLRIDVEAAAPQLFASTGRVQRSHKELLGSAQQRLILIVSDCVSPAWRSENLIDWLGDWGKAHPTGLLQVLPSQQLWSRGALGHARRWAVSAPAPAIPNQALRRRALSTLPPSTSNSGVPLMPPLPMTTLAPDRLGDWARLVAATGSVQMVGFVFQPSPIEVINKEGPIDWQARYQAFRENASPKAIKLASLLAAAPLRLPVIRLVQASLLPGSGQTHLAEFFLSGLIERVESAVGEPEPVDADQDPDQIEYDFLSPELRHRLLSDGRIYEAIAVQRCVGDYLSQRLDGPNPFLAAVESGDPSRAYSEMGGGEAFARVTQQVLNWLGVPQGHAKLDQGARRGSVAGASTAAETESMGHAESDPTAAEVRMPSPRPIRLLHLSDIHFSKGRGWDADPILRHLAKRISDDVAAGLVPDLVVCTGDLAFSGQQHEYELAKNWLESQLWPALMPDSAPELKRDRLLLVPGNHDVDRKRVDAVAEMVQTGLLAGGDQQRIAAVLGDANQRETLLKRHAAYLGFYTAWLGTKQTLPWWQRMLTINDQRLHVAGLDSAWMSCGDNDRNQLLLGSWQLKQTVDVAEAEGADWKIALLHHPWDYLAEFDAREAQRNCHQHRDLILRGHLHDPDVQRNLSPDPDYNCLEIAAGCVYEHTSYPNTFQWIELHAEPRRVRVLFRTWKNGRWIEDRNRPGCPDGSAEILFAGDFGKYLWDLHADTKWLDIRGLHTSSPEARRIPLRDLYIELQATGAALESHPGGQPLRAALCAENRLVIIGDPGCGKTTFLRWVAHCLAADRLRRDPGLAERRLGLTPTDAGPRLPLMIAIADWLDYARSCRGRPDNPTMNDGAAWLTSYLAARANDADQELKADDFRQLLKDGQAILLLDGLDEAPDQAERQQAVRRIEAVARAWPNCPMVVTSRPAAYQDKAVLLGFAQVSIQALDPPAIDGFLQRWSAALFPQRPEQAAGYHRALAAALASRREIRLLASNTVMLTALAVVHWNEKRLPEQRAELYESVLRWLSESRDQRPDRIKPQRCRQLLGELALAMLDSQQGRQVQVPRRWAAEQLADRFGADPDAVERAETFLAEEEIDSGIIVRRGHQLRFWHLSFQEYLAAQALAGRTDPDRNARLLAADADHGLILHRPEWREPVLLLAGVLYLQGEAKVNGLIGGILDRLGEQPSRAAQARAVGLIGLLLRDLDPFAFQPADRRWRQTLDAAMAVFDPEQAAAIPLRDRIAAADALALAGDPRLDWTDPERWVALPGGSFYMGAQRSDQRAPNYDPEAYENEAPVHRVRIDPFQISRFPVTVADFAQFLDDSPADPRWWRAGGADRPPEPDDWDAQQQHPSRPVVRVSWYHAMAFCAWLTDRLRRHQNPKGRFSLADGLVVQLPSERQWEYAARGKQGRRYPWGDQPPDPDRANYADAKVGDPSPVGIFPGDCTPEGVLDMAGNVVEWCLDAYDEYSEGDADNPLRIGEGGVSRVLRGGAFYFSSWDLRCSFRYWVASVNRFRYVGFRCVLAPRRQH
ncbi:MAG: SUMF1/EgtB/PvdO family nonheme iron enzyme [Thiohalocapsa sp. PB-PSB1]|jgi:formylglycine-generating enzyme required for sulfatase activity/predicted phosphodiesterase|nr:MAG: SUMF1/EgtB/PvdO family nonheme iron enzyme [Thiohalocapsa sp. PB-PSB1]